MKLKTVVRQVVAKKFIVIPLRPILLLLLLIFSSVQLHAKEFIIGVEAVRYYPLFDFDINDTSQPSYTKAILTDFFESHNYQFKLLPLPIKRFDRWYIEQGIDFKFPDNVRWRNTIKLDITYSDPVVEVVAGAWVLEKNQHISNKQVARLGTILGFYSTLWVEALQSGQTKLLEESTALGVVKHLLYGNVDATNIDETVIRHHLRELGEKRKIVLNKQIHSERFFYHLSSIKYPEIIEQFNQYLKDNTDEIEHLKRQYNIRTEFN